MSAVATPVLARDRNGARIDVALKHAPLSEAAMDVVRGPLRDAADRAAPAGATTMVGGTSAVYADVSDSVERDMRLIYPVAAGLILLILSASLRSIVAPLYLLAAVILSSPPRWAPPRSSSSSSAVTTASRSRCRSCCSCSWSRSAPTTTS